MKPTEEKIASDQVQKCLSNDIDKEIIKSSIHTISIKNLIAECTAYDFKVLLEEKKPKSWLKSVSAFANGSGGSLFFGVDNEHNVVGLEDVQNVAEAISTFVRDRMDPLPEVELLPMVADGKPIIELKVKEGRYTPYYYVGDGQRIAFVRIGDESIPATDEDMVRLVLKGSNRTYDSLLSAYSIDDYSFTILANTYRKRIQKPWDKKYLKSFGLVTDDGRLTNAGALFADDCPLTQSRLYCTKWNGREKGDAINDAEFTGNILMLLREAQNFVKSNTRNSWEKLPNGKKNRHEYAERAVLEGLVNHFIHRDYTVMGSEVHLDIYTDRLTLTSPGGMYSGVMIQNVDILEVPSDRRNPVLADVMAQLDLMEKRGSGLKRICDDTKELVGYNDELKPVFKSTVSHFMTTIFKVTIDGDDVTYNVTYDNIDEVVMKLTERQRAILSFARVNPMVTAGEMSRMLHVSERTIRRDISEMPFMKHVGDRNDGRWVIELK